MVAACVESCPGRVTLVQALLLWCEHLSLLSFPLLVFLLSFQCLCPIFSLHLSTIDLHVMCVKVVWLALSQKQNMGGVSLVSCVQVLVPDILLLMLILFLITERCKPLADGARLSVLTTISQCKSFENLFPFLLGIQHLVIPVGIM